MFQIFFFQSLVKILQLLRVCGSSGGRSCWEEARTQRTMEGGKSVEEAGPSWACSGAVENQNPEKLKDKTEKLCTSSDVEESDGEYGGKDLGDGGAVGGDGAFVPGPLLSLKEQIDKDKDDESLRRWKEKLLGCLESDLNGQMEPEVKFHSIGIVSDDFAEITTSLPTKEDEGDCVLFTLQEGCQYRLKLTFSVLHNIVSGLTYSNRVWKARIQVDQSRGMLGTFAPRQEPYVHTLDEETTPSGVLARGIYSAKLKFEDDDRRCHMELKYSFEIKKSV